jgi:hypothetical protein
VSDAEPYVRPPGPYDEVAVFVGRPILRADLYPSAQEINAARDYMDLDEIDAWRARAPALELRRIVFGGLLERYRRAEGIAATPAKIAQLLAFMERNDDTLDLSDPEARRQAEAFAGAMVLAWETNRRLYQRYGGRVIFQQAGPEPLDAYRAFLEERQAAGAFELLDDALAEEFWRYFTDENMHTFYNAADAAEAFRTPWWRSDAEPAGDAR